MGDKLVWDLLLIAVCPYQAHNVGVVVNLCHDPTHKHIHISMGEKVRKKETLDQCPGSRSVCSSRSVYSTRGVYSR